MEKVHKLTDPIFQEVLNEGNLDILFNDFYSYLRDDEIGLDEIASEGQILTLNNLGVTGLVHVETDGLEYDNQDGEIVFKFLGIDAYFRITGTYYSHVGPEKDSGWKEVFPQEVTRIIYTD